MIRIDSVIHRRPRPARFDDAALFFVFEPLSLLIVRNPRRLTFDRRAGGAGDKRRETLAGVGAVALLRAEAPRLNDDIAFIRHTPPGDGFEPSLHRVRQRRRILRVKAQLHRRLYLVDILPAGPGSADECFGEFPVRDGDGWRDLEGHGSTPITTRIN